MPSGSATSTCAGRGRWPPAPPTSCGDTAAAGELLALLDSYQPGHLAPMLRAERDLVRARLAASDGDPAAAAAFAAAITGLREHSTPYHLAHGLLDHAQYLTAPGRRRSRRGSHRAKPATSPIACAASRCWTGPRPSRPPNPRHRIRPRRYPMQKNPRPQPRVIQAAAR